MTMALAELVKQIAEITESAVPQSFEEDAPVPGLDMLESQNDEECYFIGLIGGKDVGKSALVNALVGQEITQRIGYGKGTETVIAYVHQSRQAEVAQKLEKIAPGQYTIITHDQADLTRQALLDLPDIDSIHEEHVKLTGQMLRHMLFPLWLQSVEKYADAKPRQLLQKVAEGNVPENFLFCLNKADQLLAREGQEQLEKLRQDYAARIQSLLKLKAPPRVWMISALQPEVLDLPQLRRVLAKQKSVPNVRQARQAAMRQRHLNVVRWADGLNLPGRLARLEELKRRAEQVFDQSLGAELLNRRIPDLLEDPAHRARLVDAAMDQRMMRWPMIGAVQMLLRLPLSLPLRLVFQARRRGVAGSKALVKQHLALGDMADCLKGAIVQLQQKDISIYNLYGQSRMGGEFCAAQAAQLQTQLSEAMELHKEQLLGHLLKRDRLIYALGRWLLTWGAAAWFMLLQPVMEVMLRDSWRAAARHIPLLVVQAISVPVLLSNLVFVAIWLVVLWVAVRWRVHKRVDRLVCRQGGSIKQPAAQAPLRAVVENWLAGLQAPIEQARRHMACLVEQVEALRQATAESQK